MQISPHFTLIQLVRSETADAHGIDNAAPPELIDNLTRLAQGLEQVQALLGHPLAISSAYRCPELNAIVGGAQASQHVLGEAADFDCPEFGTPLEVALAIAASGIRYDQVILEYARWVHISFNAAPRNRLLTINTADQGYLAGLWDQGGNQFA
ncbi:MAG: peptidase M15 [Betaproteobacteria bacterium]|nr:peptidase M15 [Betaproteobacteria bacterium]